MDAIPGATPRSVRRRAFALAPVVILVVLLLLLQGGTRGVSNRQVQADNEEASELGDLRHQGNALYSAGQYLHAVRIYKNGYQEAKRRGSARSEVRFLNNLGGAFYRLFRYRDAIQAYLEARDLATSMNDQEALGALYANLSSLYLQMGDLEAALESARQGLKVPSAATAKYKPKLLIQYARIKERQLDWAEAAGLLRDAVEASRAEPDMGSEAQAWNELGNALLELGQLPAGERALLEAFRLRKWTSADRLYFAYQSLGDLRVRQGDLPAASAFFDKALESARIANPPVMWGAYYDRGEVKLAQAKLDEAFADFKSALECARRWRAEVLPADAFRISSEVKLHSVYSSFIEVASRLYADTGQERFARQAFAAAEENRAASLRALWAGPDLTKELPEEYWQTLADLYKAESGLAKGEPNIDPAALQRLRLKAAETEARAGIDLPLAPGNPNAQSEDLLARTRRLLRPSEVFLGFHLGDTDSCLWTVTREGFELRRLPPRAYFTANVHLFLKALREDSPEAVPLGNQLYAKMFGDTRPRMLDKPLWIVAPDGPLFELPFAALPEAGKSNSGAPAYVVERHAIKFVTGISTLSEAAAPGLSGPIVGLGDPIYNGADPRLSRALSAPAARKPQSPVRPVELPRLVGSSREIENYAAIWRARGYDPVVLQGGSATRENFTRALRSNPAVVHVAAHLVFPPEPSSPGLLALALQPGGQIELLSASEIAAMRLKLGLVVLNGCSSAHAAALPGAGLMGMTRAWLAAGAHAVIVTRWPTADQSAGQLFQSFYERVSSMPASRQQRSFAELLQEAQLDELHAGGQRANPAYWAGYFCVERN